MGYETDFHAWTRAQADALRRAEQARVNVPDAIDWGQIAEAARGDKGRESATRSAPACRCCWSIS